MEVKQDSKASGKGQNPFIRPNPGAPPVQMVKPAPGSNLQPSQHLLQFNPNLGPSPNHPHDGLIKIPNIQHPGQSGQHVKGIMMGSGQKIPFSNTASSHTDHGSNYMPGLQYPMMPTTSPMTQPDFGLSAEEMQKNGNVDYYLELNSVARFEVRKQGDMVKGGSFQGSNALMAVELPKPKETTVDPAVLKEKMCHAKKLKCQKKGGNEDLDDILDGHDSQLIGADQPLPVVKGISDQEAARDQLEQCNAYCRWVRKQLELETCIAKPDALLKMRELGEKYVKDFGGIKSVLINLSGTLTQDGAPTENAPKAIELLRKFGLKIRFLTNSTQDCKRVLLRKLVMMGFGLEGSEIFTSLSAAKEMIEKNNLRPYFLVEETALEDFEGLNTNNPNAVVVGLSLTNFNYLRFNKALRLVMSGAPIIAIHMARLHKSSDGMTSLGPGPFVDVLEYATSGKSYLIGKPCEDFFRAAITSAGFDVNDTVVIGDDMTADIEGGMRCGMKGILVQTGKYQENDERSIGGLTPTLVAKNFWVAARCIVGSVAIASGIDPMEEEEEEENRAKAIRKKTANNNSNLIEKIESYVNNCGIPIWCLERKEILPPLLKPSEYYTDDTGLHPLARKGKKASN